MTSKSAARPPRKRWQSLGVEEKSTPTSNKRKSSVRRQGQRDQPRDPRRVSFEEPSLLSPTEDPHKLLGSRLEPIKKDLAPQPMELQITIIELVNSMLKRRSSIEQRRKSILRFSKPVPATTQDKSQSPKNSSPTAYGLTTL